MPQARPAARKPGGQHARLELRRRPAAHPPSASGRSVPFGPLTGRPTRVSSMPSITFMFCTACPAAPFQRLSIAANASTRPSGDAVAWIRQKFVSRTSRTPGGAAASSMKGSLA